MENSFFVIARVIYFCYITLLPIWSSRISWSCNYQNLKPLPKANLLSVKMSLSFKENILNLDLVIYYIKL